MSLGLIFLVHIKELCVYRSIMKGCVIYWVAVLGGVLVQVSIPYRLIHWDANSHGTH